VTGGAGFLGINLCRQLLRRGQRVRSLDIADFDYDERSDVEALRGDIRDSEAVRVAMQGVDVVVHCAAALPLAPEHEIRTTEVDGTRLLLDHAARQSVRRFIYISSTAVYGVPDHSPLLETDRLHGVGPYGESKIAAETLCQQSRNNGMCISILRPKTFVGPERLGAFEILYQWAYEGRHFPVIGSGTNRYQLLDVEDLCTAIWLCANATPNVADDTYNIAAFDFGTMRDNVQVVLDRAGHRRHAIPLPRAPAVAALKVLRALHLSPLYPWIYETAAEHSEVSIERAIVRLRFKPRYSNRDALTRNFDWYVANRRKVKHLTGTTHREPWKKGILNFVRHLF